MDKAKNTAELAEYFLLHCAVQEKLSPGTLKQYGWVVRKLCEYPLTAKGWQRFLESIADKAPATRSFRLIVARKFLRWCKENGYLKGKPFWESAELPRFKNVPHYLTEEELDRFLKAIDDTYWYGFFYFLANTGLRLGELLSLRLEDITVDDGTAYVRVRGKGAKERVIPVDKRCLKPPAAQGCFPENLHIPPQLLRG